MFDFIHDMEINLLDQDFDEKGNNITDILYVHLEGSHI